MKLSDMNNNRLRLEISRSLLTITTDFFTVCEDVDIHIPKNVTQIEEAAFSLEDGSSAYQVDIYYDGTIEEWNNIKKGLIIEKTTEDWYGYYYHNSSRYETSRIYYSWFKNHEKGIIVIHCLDGDTKPVDSVDRQNFLREEK